MQNFLENRVQAQHVKGFSLIELMIVVVVIGILTAIAYPNYIRYTLRAHRADAQAYLLNVAQRQTQYYLDNRAYAPDLATLFGSTSPVPANVLTYYGTPVVTTTLGPPPGFTITATPQGTQNAYNEPVLTINQAGAKTPTGTAYGSW